MATTAAIDAESLIDRQRLGRFHLRLLLSRYGWEALFVVGLPRRGRGHHQPLPLGGTFGGLAMSLILDRFGLRAPLLFLLLAVVSLVVAASISSPSALQLAVAACGVAVIGVQFGLNASAGLIYPTGVRSSGVGAALSVGRIGSILGPIIGGLLLATAGLDSGRLFLAPILPLAIGLVANLFLVRRSRA